MKRTTLLPLAFISLVAGVSLVGCAATAARSTAADEAAIMAFNKLYLGAINNGDSATLASLTTEDHMMISSGRAPLAGKKANIEAMERAFQNTSFVETWTPLETVISSSGDLAYQRGTFTVDATPKAGGAPTHSAGNFMRIYRRQPNGEWRMTRDTFNTAR
ncbi:MAG: DUF4440 domain-containing protein [Gammaproteobacteria bacterium]